MAGVESDLCLSDSQNRKSKRLESCVLVDGSNNVYLNGRLRSPLHKRSNMSSRRMRQAAVENEVAEYLERYRHGTDNKRHRFAVRNGYLPERKILSGVDQLSVKVQIRPDSYCQIT